MRITCEQKIEGLIAKAGRLCARAESIMGRVETMRMVQAQRKKSGRKA